MPNTYLNHHLTDIIQAYHDAPTPLLREAVGQWLAHIVLLNLDGYADDDPELVCQAQDIIVRQVSAFLRSVGVNP